MKGLGDEISRKRRKNKKPPYISDNDWAILMEDYQTEVARTKSEKAVRSRTTKIDGIDMHKHTAGPNSFSKIEFEMKQSSQGSEPPSILDLVKMTHRRADGSYVDKVVEGLVNEVEQAATQLHHSPGSVGSTTGPSREVINQLYIERANPRYGQLYGTGSARMQFYEPIIEYPTDNQEDLRGEMNQMKTKMDRMEEKIDMMVQKLFGGHDSSSRSQPANYDPSQMPSVRLDFDQDL